MEFEISDVDEKLTNGIIKNDTLNEKIYNLKNKMIENEKSIKVKFNCKVKSGYAYININNLIDIPAEGEAIFGVIPEQKINIKLVLGAKTEIEFSNIVIETKHNDSFNFAKKEETLVIISDYPTCFCNKNDYVHELNKKYVKNGLKMQVASINNNNWYELKYEIDNVEVIRGNYNTLKELLIDQIYKNIIVYSVDENILKIFNGYTNPEQKLIFKIKGNELLTCFNNSNYRIPYFVGEYEDNQFAIKNKKDVIDRYSKMENVTWIFQSQRLEKHYKKIYNFKNTYIFTEKTMDYEENKNHEKENKIVIIKNFDNIAFNKVDECVLTILELSKRNGFDKLKFEIYGDGVYMDKLLEPIKKFKNVKINRQKNIDKNKIFNDALIYFNPGILDMSDAEIDMALANKCYIVTSNANIKYEKNENVIFETQDFVEMADKIIQIVDKKTENDFKEKTIIQNDESLQEIELVRKLVKIKYNDMKYEKSKNPVLTIAIPSYNVEKYLTKCLSSLIYQKNINKMEILVINDGSKDGTRDIALKFEKKTQGIVKLIDKENGGHGSGVNMGMKLAKGKYFKILDSDDWIDSENLEILIDKMEKSDADLILTNVCKEFVPVADLDVIIKYVKLHEGKTYRFEDLMLGTYGFSTNPLFAACSYKTEKLRQANFAITEKKLYADHEFDAFALKCIETIEYYPLNIYMYLIGRNGQSVSIDVWRKKYKDHQSAIFTMLDKLEQDIEFKKCKKEFIYRLNVTAMVVQQINTMLELNKKGEVRQFIKKLSEYSEAYSIVKTRMLEFELCPFVKNLLLNKRKSRVKGAIKEMLPYCIVIKLKKKGIIL